jgi:hypothetical protein
MGIRAEAGYDQLNSRRPKEASSCSPCRPPRDALYIQSNRQYGYAYYSRVRNLILPIQNRIGLGAIAGVIAQIDAGRLGREVRRLLLLDLERRRRDCFSPVSTDNG